MYCFVNMHHFVLLCMHVLLLYMLNHSCWIAKENRCQIRLYAHGKCLATKRFHNQTSVCKHLLIFIIYYNYKWLMCICTLALYQSQKHALLRSWVPCSIQLWLNVSIENLSRRTSKPIWLFWNCICVLNGRMCIPWQTYLWLLCSMLFQNKDDLYCFWTTVVISKLNILATKIPTACNEQNLVAQQRLE